MPRIQNFAITRQFPGGRNESEKITFFVQLEEGDKPGDTYKDVHSLVISLDPFGPWSPEDVEHATRSLSGGSSDPMRDDLAKRILADHDEWKLRRNAAIDRLNQLGVTMDPKPKPTTANIPPPVQQAGEA